MTQAEIQKIEDKLDKIFDKVSIIESHLAVDKQRLDDQEKIIGNLAEQLGKQDDRIDDIKIIIAKTAGAVGVIVTLAMWLLQILPKVIH